ncbi:ABC transporter substrate-binding protein [Pseudoalteromonas sp. MMG013]|uniref:ABC transporter substrate-binding protein n=1 Tax=Pseudoalteromonas sp. MMG013 TaxID=2822687 RepID=UPI001B3956E8|nr:ABC transporter substrate-binding protein [Pseudoalteromonas sp. MMG013]MBQ4860203.1 ABC transporter substrate-binding protein [Pseudoalteromonas sp. MMG013]
MKLPIISLVFLFIFSCHALSSTKVTFINPGYEFENPTGDFWLNVTLFMQAAADDLDIQLTVHYAERNHIVMKQMVRKALQDTSSYLILVDEKSVITDTLINSTQTHPAIVFLLNKPHDQQMKRINSKGFGILSSIMPDNFQAGKLLAQHLNTIVTPPKSYTRNQMIALLGETATLAARNREQGLLSYSNREPSLQLKQRISANWSHDEAFQLTLGLMQRLPDTKIIWAANDAMAMGSVQALEKLGVRKKVKVGGINWDKNQHLALDASVGGHVTLGGLAMVKIYDHARNKKPIQSEELYPIFDVFSEKYMPLYRAIHDKNVTEIDFTQFSETAGSPLNYNLDVLNGFFK